MVQSPDGHRPDSDDRTIRNYTSGVAEIKGLMSLNNQPGDQPPYALSIVDTINGRHRTQDHIVQRSRGLLQPADIASLVNYAPEIVFDSRVVRMQTRHVFDGVTTAGTGLGGATLFDFNEFLGRTGRQADGDSVIKFFQLQLITASGLHAKAPEITKLALDILELGTREGDEARDQRISYLRDEFPMIAQQTNDYLTTTPIPAILPIVRMPEPELVDVEGTAKNGKPAAQRQLELLSKLWKDLDTDYLRDLMSLTANEFGTGLVITPKTTAITLVANRFTDSIPGLSFANDVPQAMQNYNTMSSRYAK